MKTAFILSSLMAAGLALSACAQTPATPPAPGGETAGAGSSRASPG